MFCWSQLGTTDLEGAKRFYGGLFGWGFQEQPLPEMQKFNLITRNGLPVGAVYPMSKEHKEEADLGVSWLPFVAVDSADKAGTVIKQSGGKVVIEPNDAIQDGQRNGRFGLFQDPTRALFAVWQAGSKPGAAVVNETGSMCWNELITDDARKAEDFYKRVFGWTSEKVPMQRGGNYTMFKKDTVQAAGMMQATPEMKLTHPYWLIYFGADDCDKSADKAKQLGGKIQMPPTDIPNVGRFSVISDPQGGYFAIFKPLPRP